MKEKIFNGLKTKFEGVKPEILDRIAHKAAKTITTDDEVTTYLEGVTIQTIMDAYGDNRATDAQKTAVANYEKKHNIKDGKPVAEHEPPKPNEETTDPDTPAWAKALIESNKALADKVAAMEGEKLATTRKGKLDAMLADIPDNVRKVYESSFNAMKFDDDAAFDAWLEVNKPIIEGIIKDNKAHGAASKPPMGGGKASQPGEVNPMLKTMVEEQKNAPQQPTPFANAPIMGMPTAPAN